MEGVIFVAFGANLPHPDGRSALQTCIDAREAIARLPGLSLLTASQWYVSAPEPPSGQPDYINGVVSYRCHNGIDPAGLLAALQAIETGSGRQRSVPNAARTLDLDIVAIESDGVGMVRDAPDPILPHPRAHLRGFVLAPLAEIAPGWVHPVLETSAEVLLAAVPADAVPVALHNSTAYTSQFTHD